MPSPPPQPRSSPRPPQAVAQFQAALRFQAQQRKLEAAQCYIAVLRAAPDFFEASFNLGLLLHEMGQPTEALACYRQTLQFNPEFAPAWNQLGLVLRASGQKEEAIGCFQRALQIQPRSPHVLNNLGNALRARQHHPEAIASFQAALRLAPNDAEISLNLGNTLREEDRLAEAAEAITRATRLRPDFAQAYCDLAFLHLLQGDFQRGFQAYEWRWRRPSFPPRTLPAPLWDGQDPAGRTVLLHTEQGAGDTLQFVRLARPLTDLGARVLLECPASLAPLLASVDGVSKVISRGEPLPPFDCHLPLLSLPHRLGLTLSSIPSTTPYLRAPLGRSLPLPALPQADARPRVGLVWQGNPDHKNDAQRSLPAAALEELLSNREVVFYSLQVGVSLSATAQSQGMLNVSGLIHDFADTALLINQLDLVISVDTSVAHLAGALGRPVWILLPYAPDWRWLRQRNDSPWYPTARLFRQPARGDWASVLREVGVAFHSRLATNPQPSVFSPKSALKSRRVWPIYLMSEP